MQNKTRRKILETATAGTAIGIILPKAWIKPIVESVILPAHAQASTSESFSCEITGSPNVQIFSGSSTGPFIYTITNTGTEDLTNTSGGIGNVTSGVGFSTSLPSLPDPFVPGDTINFPINTITTTSCPTSGEQIIVSFNSDEAPTCEFIVNVSCINN